MKLLDMLNAVKPLSLNVLRVQTILLSLHFSPRKTLIAIITINCLVGNMGKFFVPERTLSHLNAKCFERLFIKFIMSIKASVRLKKILFSHMNGKCFQNAFSSFLLNGEMVKVKPACLQIKYGKKNPFQYLTNTISLHNIPNILFCSKLSLIFRIGCNMSLFATSKYRLRSNDEKYCGVKGYTSTQYLTTV